jgi:Cu-Zn family superoxide dismutase
MTSAIAVFQGMGGVHGTVRFIQHDGYVDILLDLSGLKKNGYHGFHIHEYGDLSDGCTSACAHFNPFNKTHGCPGMSERHVGDLGNIVTDMFGNAQYKTYDILISLTDIQTNIVGRMLIIHADQDDCGRGQGSLQAESLKTGNAGKRIACAVIGYSK